ncbi:MAG: substrate-binding domain-containing protein [Anaerolineae bacterium]|nr:substrate-binding domain-containing protein [Anaerolineae bacterium]
MKRTARILATLVLTTLTGCSTPALPPPATRSVTWLSLYTTPEAAPTVLRLTQGFQALQPAVRFDTRPGSPSRLLAGPAQDAAYLVSHHLPASSDLWAAPLAQDGLIFIVHPANPVQSLSTEDLRRLYQGFTTDWQQVGGAALPVHLLIPAADSALRLEMERLVMGQRRVAPVAEIVPSPAAALARVAALPGAIACIPYSQPGITVRTLAIGGIQPSAASIAAGHYPLRMTLFIMGLEAPQGLYRAFVDYAQSDHGQQQGRPGATPGG